MLNNKITRRVFLGTTALVVSAPILAMMPASSSNNQLHKITQAGQFFDAKQLTVLVDVADIMIPSTDTPSASEAHVIAVLDAMMLTWAGTETKGRYTSFIKQLEQLALDTFQTAYTECSTADRTTLVTQIDQRSFDKQSSELSKNYRKLKEMIFHIYYTSEAANPDYLAIPGTYKGCLSKAEYDAMVNQRLGRSA